jgi:trimethylamine:corrinoid methyltransferase-like protein
MVVAKSETALSSGIHPGIHQLVQILSPADVEAIHAASMRILEKVGVRIEHETALELLSRNGARVDGDLVRMPTALVQKALDSAPAQVTLYARDRQHDIFLGRGSVHFTNGFGATWVLDHASQTARSAVLEDLAVFTRLADALKHVHYCLFSVVPQDVPPQLLDVVSTATVLKNTRKHTQLSLEGARWLDQVIEIASCMVEPGEPLPISAGGVPNSPLHYTPDVITKFIGLAQHEIPCFIVCGAMAGASAPVTLAGMLVEQNAEFLAGLVVHQLANPGAPVIYGTFSAGFDMRYTKIALGGPESSLITAATQQFADYYGVPLGYATGGVTDSPYPDVQAGIEKAFGVLAAALSGVDVIHDAVSGLIGSAMMISMPQMIIDHDLCASVDYYLQGVPVSVETIAETVFEEVGIGGSFLTTDHTARNFRKSLFMTPIRARNQQPDEVDALKSISLETAAEKAAEILAKHEPLPIGAAQTARIESILEQCARQTN